MTRRVVAAKLVGTFGVHGELKCQPSRTGEPSIAAGRTFALSQAEDAPRVTLAAVRRHHGRALVTLDGVATEEAARAYVGKELFLDRADVELDEGEYLDDDLIGLRVEDETGLPLGVVRAVEHYPAQDCLVVGARGLIPMVAAFIRSIDVAAGSIVVSVPPGLIDPSAAEEA
jgi:16S rRNA processing protein RimM